jgi:hypothetical protein
MAQCFLSSGLAQNDEPVYERVTARLAPDIPTISETVKGVVLDTGQSVILKA